MSQILKWEHVPKSKEPHFLKGKNIQTLKISLFKAFCDKYHKIQISKIMRLTQVIHNDLGTLSNTVYMSQQIQVYDTDRAEEIA